MRSETPRHLALTALDRVFKKDDFSGKALADVFLHHLLLDERDRAFTSHLVQGVLRWRMRLDWMIEQASDFPLKKIDPSVLNILRLALYQIFFLDKVPDSAAVNEAVNQCKRLHAPHIGSFVNGILRNICRGKDQITFPEKGKDPAFFLSVYYSCPLWMVKKWIREWGTEWAEGFLDASNRVPPLTIRTNTLKIDRPGLLRVMEEEGLKGIPTPFAPEGIEVEGMRGRVDASPAFIKGLYQVQDQAAQITSRLLAPRPGERILDLCAGLGGKTTHLAALMGDQGLIVALDTNRRRLVSLTESCVRLGIRSISPVTADASKGLSGLFSAAFDRILIDAPCSGLGTLSRHPDGKWRRREKDIQPLARLQREILRQAAPHLRKGGKMLYV
ncbi:MAG: 16S rRNA (cytosine(967)-C(5))-methyltransferase RsmB, partial [Pseudomonadota bacterium]